MPNKVDFDTEGTLRNFVDAYSLNENDKQSLIIIESIANSLDANASKVDIRLGKIKNKYIYSILDDGEGMDKEKFRNNYHRFSSSSKTKGDGIGFAGVGAKLCFHFNKDIRISTTTIGQDGSLSSQMWWKDDSIEWDYIQVDKSIENRIRKFSNKGRGTYYEVTLDYPLYNYLYNNYERVIREWYNTILLSLYPNKTITFKSKRIEPEQFTYIFNTKETLKIDNHKFICYFYVLDGLPTRKSIVGINYIVYGKFIKNDKIESSDRIKPEYRDKIFALILADSLANNLNFQKQSFTPGATLYTKAKRKIEQKLLEWLKKNGCVSEYISSSSTKEMERLQTTLQKLLHNKKYKAFNPFLKPMKVSTLIKNDEGTITGEYEEGMQPTLNYGKGGKRGDVDIGDEAGSSPMRDEAGNMHFNEKEKRARGPAIKGVYEPKDNREAWVDPATQFVVINQAHKFYTISNKAGKDVQWMQLTKAVVDALAYYKADEIAKNDYKKISELKYDLCLELWSR